MRILTAGDIEDYEEEEEEPIYCQMCLKRGYQNRMGGKILMPNEPRPPDYDEWLGCVVCGWLCPIYAAEKEAEIKDSIETQQNPFEDKLKFVSVPTRTAEKGRKPRVKRTKKDKDKLHDDPDINALMRISGEQNVRVVYDSNP
jgi:MinD superfamily P-loop ATPase